MWARDASELGGILGQCTPNGSVPPNLLGIPLADSESSITIFHVAEFMFFPCSGVGTTL